MFNFEKNPAASKINLYSLLIIFIFAVSENVYSQNLEWRELPGVPNTLGRYDDLSFINMNTGWVIDNERVFKTTDGGTTWVNYSTGMSGNRSIGFFDSQTGILGHFSTTTNSMQRTTNGGVNWAALDMGSGAINGICGISIADSNTAYACGTYYTYGRAFKTTDKGQTWAVVFNDTSLARTLIDCYFWSSDSGLIAGGYNTGNFMTGYSVVLRTVDGGNSWQRVFKSQRTGEWCWKISFNPAYSKSFGVISIERFSGTSFYLKTTNQGLSWQENSVMTYHEQGIGFLNENTGWIGGAPNDSTMQTTDGGISWMRVGWSRHLNRIRFINDTIAYACGSTVSKYSRDIVNIAPVAVEVPQKFILHQNYPNPFNPKTVIKFDVPAFSNENKSLKISLIVYDQLGKVVSVLVNETALPGSYESSFDGGYYPSGIYYYRLEAVSGANILTETKKMLILK